MKRSRLFICLLAGFAAVSASADELFVTEPVSMGEARSVSVELRPSYRTDLWKITNTNTEITDTFLRTALAARWVPVEKVEVLLEVPHVSDKIELDDGTTTSDTSESGLGQVVLGGKYGFCPNGSAALRVEMPNADQDKGLGEGTNFGVSLQAEKALGPVKGFANLGYLIKSEYETDFDVAGAAKTKIDPGDILQVNVGVSHNRWDMDWVGELACNFIGKQKIAKVTQAGTDGTAVDLILGAHKTINETWGVKGALALGIAEEESRSVDLARGAGDYKIILAGDYRFNY